MTPTAAPRPPRRPALRGVRRAVARAVARAAEGVLGRLTVAAAALLLAAPLAAPVVALDAQERRPPPRVVAAPAAVPAALPFAVGERLEYDVKVGPLRVGRGHMEVVGFEPVRGQEALHIAFRVSGGALGIRVSDAMDSWVEPRTFTSLRFVQELHERGKDRDRRFEIYPERGVFVEEGKPEAPTVERPLDDGSLFYYVRTLPLVVGEEYVLDRYFRPDRNPVRVRVLRRERVKVPAGEFDAIVIRPIIKTKGLFAESANAELWLSDDDRRMLLKMRSEFSFGSLSLHLRRAVTGAEP